MTSDEESIDQFMGEWRRPNRSCPVCELPEREGIEYAWSLGRRAAFFKAWLTEKKGYTKSRVTELDNALYTHFARGHHERG
jgi:hypothetical protein